MSRYSIGGSSRGAGDFVASRFSDIGTPVPQSDPRARRPQSRDRAGYGGLRQYRRAVSLRFEYGFDNLEDDRPSSMQFSLARYAPYIFDCGEPTGLRLAMKHPERITGIVTQNVNA
jgi:hypothetical protein